MKKMMAPLRRLIRIVADKAFFDGADKADEFAAKQAGGTGVKRMLDVGCGDGETTVRFATLIGAEAVFGVDFDVARLKDAESRGITCYTFDLNGKWDIESEGFDLILSRFSFEHLHYTRIFLKECYRCLVPGGKLVIITENLSSWLNVGALLFGWQPFSLTQFDGWFIGNPLAWRTGDTELERSFDYYEDACAPGMMGHVRVLAFQGIKELLGRAGFKDICVVTRGYLPLWGRLSDILSRVDPRHGHILVAVCSK